SPKATDDRGKIRRTHPRRLGRRQDAGYRVWRNQLSPRGAKRSATVGAVATAGRAVGLALGGELGRRAASVGRSCAVGSAAGVWAAARVVFPVARGPALVGRSAAAVGG